MGTCRRSPSSSSHASRSMSNNIVRLAFVASVAKTSPPVRFQISHVSMVPSARDSVTGTPPGPSNHSNLVPLKYGSSTRPVRRRTRSRAPCSASSSHRPAVLRSCHTMAWPCG